MLKLCWEFISDRLLFSVDRTFPGSIDIATFDDGTIIIDKPVMRAKKETIIFDVSIDAK